MGRDAAPPQRALLEVKDLTTEFVTGDGVVRAVDNVSFSRRRGQTLGIVGESGSGKSVTCLTVMGLNERRSSRSTGQAIFKGENLLTAPKTRLRKIRGNEMAMIFQDPMTSLNPVRTIGRPAPGGGAAPQRRFTRRGVGQRPRASCERSASRTRRGACTTTRTSSPAACGSA